MVFFFLGSFAFKLSTFFPLQSWPGYAVEFFFAVMRPQLFFYLLRDESWSDPLFRPTARGSPLRLLLLPLSKHSYGLFFVGSNLVLDPDFERGGTVSFHLSSARSCFALSTAFLSSTMTPSPSLAHFFTLVWPELSIHSPPAGSRTPSFLPSLASFLSEGGSFPVASS